jgi:YcxB-like protein
MDSPIRVSFQYSEHDYVRAMRLHYASVLRLKLDIAVIVVVASLGVYELQTPDPRWYGIVSLSLSAVLALILVAAFWVIPVLAFRREPKFRDEYSLTFSPEGIHFHTAHIDSQIQWSLYSRALVDAYSYVLYYGTRSFSVVPTRVFENADQRAAFDRLLSEKIPKIIRKGT